jgi:hypothetical protein
MQQGQQQPGHASRVQRIAALVYRGVYPLCRELERVVSVRDPDVMHAACVFRSTKLAARAFKKTLGLETSTPFDRAFVVYAVDALTREAAVIDPTTMSPTFEAVSIMSEYSSMERDLSHDVHDAMAHPVAGCAGVLPFLALDATDAMLIMVAVRRALVEHVVAHLGCAVSDVPGLLHQVLHLHMPDVFGRNDDFKLYLDAQAIVQMLHMEAPRKYDPARCAACGQACRHRCHACGAPAYCGRDCQAAHWRAVHKHECQGLGARISAPVDEQLMASLTRF